MRKLMVALLLVPVLACCARAEEERKEDRDDREEREDREERDAWEQLDKRVSVDFKETALTDAVAFFGSLGKINIVLHRKVREKLGKSPVTMKLTSVPLGHAVRVLAAAEGLECAMMGEGILLLRFQDDGAEPAGKLSLKMGSLTLELNIKQGDLPPEMRRELIHRAMRQMEFEAEMREQKMEKWRRGMELWEEKKGKKDWGDKHDLEEVDPGDGKKPEQF